MSGIKRLIYGVMFIVMTGRIAALPAAEKITADFPAPSATMTDRLKEQGLHQAVLAGGCFWGMEAVFERLKGVTSVVSGYSGGAADTATYYQVGTGTTGHAESILITYDSARISYTTLLKIFFAVAHDPTQLNYQGPDVGTEYRSVIFYLDEEQKQLAEEYIRLLDRAGAFPGKIVTEIARFEAFYPAEAYHQDFMSNNPGHPYIVHWDMPKVEHLVKAFPELVKK